MKKRTFLVLPITFATIGSMGMLAYGSWIFPFVDSTVGITVDKKSKIVVENYYFKNKKEDNSPYAKFVDLASGDLSIVCVIFHRSNNPIISLSFRS